METERYWISSKFVCFAEELKTLRVQYQELSNEYQILQESNKIMVDQLEKLESMKCR